MPSSTSSWASDAPVAAEGLLSPSYPTVPALPLRLRDYCPRPALRAPRPYRGGELPRAAAPRPSRGGARGGVCILEHRDSETQRLSFFIIEHKDTKTQRFLFSASLRLCVPIKKNFVSSCLCVQFKQKSLRLCVPLKGCSSYSSSSQSSKNRALAFSVAVPLPKSPSKPLAQSMPQSFNSMALVAGLSYIFSILKPFIFLSLLFRYECRHPSVSAC